MSALAARGLTLVRGGRTLLAPTDLALVPGQLTVLFGPSGAGKTSLLRLLAGLDRASAGGAFVGDAPVVPGAAVSLVLQDLGLWPHCTATRHVTLALAARGVARRARAERGAALFDQVGLDRTRRAAYPHELSGGEAQRLALARALATDPRALLLDEPLASLDGLAREPLFELVLGLARAPSRTVLYVTHDRLEALGSDRLVVLVAGRVKADGPPAELYRRPPTALVARLLGPVALLAAHKDGDRLVSTPLGAIAVDTTARATGAVLACVRPEHVALDPDGPHHGVVAGARHLGVGWRVELTLASGERLWAASDEEPTVGTHVRFRLTGSAWVVPDEDADTPLRADRA